MTSSYARVSLLSSVDSSEILNSQSYEKWFHNVYSQKIRHLFSGEGKKKEVENKSIIKESIHFKYFMMELYSDVDELGLNIKEGSKIYYNCYYSNFVGSSFCDKQRFILKRNLRVFLRVMKSTNKKLCEIYETHKDSPIKSCKNNDKVKIFFDEIERTIAANLNFIEAKQEDTKVSIANDLIDEERKLSHEHNFPYNQIFYSNNSLKRREYLKEKLNKNVKSFLKENREYSFNNPTLVKISGIPNLVQILTESHNKELRIFGLGLKSFLQYQEAQNKGKISSGYYPFDIISDSRTKLSSVGSYLSASHFLNIALYRFVKSISKNEVYLELNKKLGRGVNLFVIDLILSASHINTYHPITYVRNVRDLLNEVVKWNPLWNNEFDHVNNLYGMLIKMLHHNTPASQFLKELNMHALEAFYDLFKSTGGNLVDDIYLDYYSPRLDYYSGFPKMFYSSRNKFTVDKNKLTNIFSQEIEKLEFYEKEIKREEGSFKTHFAKHGVRRDTSCYIYENIKYLPKKFTNPLEKNKTEMNSYLKTIAQVCLMGHLYNIPLDTRSFIDSSNQNKGSNDNILVDTFMFNDIILDKNYFTMLQDLKFIQKSLILNYYFNVYKGYKTNFHKAVESFKRNWIMIGNNYERSLHVENKSPKIFGAGLDLAEEVIKYVLEINEINPLPFKER